MVSSLESLVMYHESKDMMTESVREKRTRSDSRGKSEMHLMRTRLLGDVEKPEVLALDP
jgi:hypothetical protein